MSDTPARLDPERLRWQCRRGMLELDFVLERYLDQQFMHADLREQQLFTQLLGLQDPDLNAWIFGGHAAPDAELQHIIDRVRGL